MMKFARVLIVAGIAALGAACATGHTGNKSLEEYCSIGDNADTDICKVNAAGIARDNATRAVAQQGVDAAGRAQATADAALARQDGVFCETRTFNRTDRGSCAQGYTLVGCAQSRYTYRAGGPTVMRDMDDQTCRFATRVLEIKARCCMVGASRAPTDQPVSEQPQQQQQPAPERTS
jgi:hypothetical protein